MSFNTVVKLLFTLSLSTVPINCFAGAWTLDRKQAYIEYFFQRFRNTEDFNLIGQRESKPNAGFFRELRHEAKGEVGVFNNRFNLLFALPVESASYRDYNVRLRTFGTEEMRLGAKIRMTDETAPVIVASQGMVEFRTPGCDPKDQPPLADCQTNIEGRIILSKALLGQKRTNISRIFVSGEFGYRFRRGAPANEAPYFSEFGCNLWKVFWIKGTADGVLSRSFPSKGDEEDYHKWSAALLLSRDPSQRTEPTWTVEAGYGSVYAGKNTGAGLIFFAKVARQFGSRENRSR